MKIVVNGEEREIEEGSTVAGLVRRLALAPERVAVELNREVVRRARWEETKLSEGDRVEVVHFVGGGSENGAHISSAHAATFRTARPRRSYIISD